MGCNRSGNSVGRSYKCRSYTTLPASQCEFIVKNSGSKLFFVSTGIQLKKAVAIFRNCPDLKSVIAFDEPKVKKDMDHDFVSLFDTICSLGSGSYPKHEGVIQERIDSFVRSEEHTSELQSRGHLVCRLLPEKK